MVQLDTADLQGLVATLVRSELMKDADSRREALRLSGLDRLLPLLDLSGSPFVVSSRIVGFLSNYGRLTYENEALGLFLNTIKMGVGVTDQEGIDRLLVKYNLMVPIAPPKAVADWRSPDTASTVVEKIFGETTLRPISFLEQGTRSSRAVAFVDVRDGVERWSGTGFLIGSNLLMTNHHVVPEKKLLGGTIVRFNYQEDFERRALPTKDYGAAQAGAFRASAELDYAILELEREPGGEWGWLPLQVHDVRKGNRINVIQHPNGQTKQISMHNNLVEYVGGNVLQYVTSTSPGSSGSPVLNDQWQVVGLHHAGGRLVEPTTGKMYGRNEGILIQSILADLPQDLRARVDAAASH
jgi:V8-like Glu-specific endopeptidase